MLPTLPTSGLELTSDCLRVGPPIDDPSARSQLSELLQVFHPWRKGPFCVHGIHIDTEWRSDWKWSRLHHALDLRGKTVLDVGCGNGYYGWRMVGCQASLVVGVDPTLLYVMQYAAIRHFIGYTPNYVLPLRLEELPPGEGAFDVAFSMGVLYHRRDPLEHLRTLRAHVKPGGQLVLETLVADSIQGEILVPAERYARMKNVWSVPTVPTAMRWLEQSGFRDTRCIDITRTTVEEQRSTEWMRFESLSDCLDPTDPTQTCEGYPAPMRAVFIATA
jgi:tRNA (mo5U34)-methyltransferase